MNQNGNQTNGEVPGDQFNFTVTVFVSGPIVATAIAAPDGSASFFTVTFNKAIDPTIVTAIPTALVVVGPNGQVPASSITITQLSSTSFQVNLPSIPALTSYSIAIGPSVTDTSGNAMNTNLNQINGEFPGDRFNFSMENTGTPPPPPPPPPSSSNAAIIVTGADAGGGPNGSRV